MTLGRLSSAELAQNEAMSAYSCSASFCAEPQQRPAVIISQKGQQQVTDMDLMSCNSVDYADQEQAQDYYKAERVRLFIFFDHC